MAFSPDTTASNPTRELAAIMFSDVAGYTAIMGRDEARALRVLAEHRALLRTLLPKFNGRMIGEIGDGTLTSFHSALEAVNCAREVQASLEGRDEFRVRIGIHVGDVLFSNNDVHGDGVNVASRIHALASPGGICISERVYEDIRNKPEMRAKDLGEKRLKNVPRPIRVYALAAATFHDQERTEGNPRFTSRALAAGVAVLLMAVLAFGIAKWRSSAPGSAAQFATQPRVIHSIAVLPLDNYSGDPNQEYFSDGMTDELTTDLATISALRVISRGSVMQFKGAHRPPTPAIAKALNVDAVVEGSVVRFGDKVRITAQLIDAPDDKHLWARSYERSSRDVLALQDELASAIAKEIKVQVTPSEQARLTSAPTVNPAAHDAYLMGRYFFNRPSDENLRKAIAQFNEAVKLDPNFAAAYSGLSDAYLWAGFNESVLTSAQAMPLAKENAEKAIQLDDTSAEGHASLASVKFFYEFDWIGGEAESRRASALDPNYAFAHDQLGTALGCQGRLDEAQAEGQRAMELDPLSPQILLDLAMPLAWQGKYDNARELARKAVEIDPTYFMSHGFAYGWIDIQAGKVSRAIPELEQAHALESPPWVAAWLGYAYAAAGQDDRALAMIEELHRRSIRGYVPPFNLAIVYLGMGDRERALDGLEKAHAASSQGMMGLKMDRIFDPLRKEPRFIALMKKLNFDK